MGNYDNTLCVVNRYDGIDLPDKHCRILVLDSKPYSGDRRQASFPFSDN